MKKYIYSNLNEYKENKSCFHLPIGFCEKKENNKENFDYDEQKYWFWKTNYINLSISKK